MSDRFERKKLTFLSVQNTQKEWEKFMHQADMMSRTIIFASQKSLTVQATDVTMPNQHEKIVLTANWLFLKKIFM